MGEEDRGGLPNLDPDLSKNWGGLPNVQNFRGNSRKVEAILTLPDFWPKIFPILG